jgi:hypothetical protein
MTRVTGLAATRAILLAGTFLLLSTSARAAWPEQAIANDDPYGDASYSTPAPDNEGRDDLHWVLDPRTQCWAYNSHAGANDSISWTGGCSDNAISGQGTLTFYNAGKMVERITGDFDEGVLEEGHVSIAWADGTRYDGQERNGQFNGQGILIAASGNRYDGMWQDGEFKGPYPAARAPEAAPAPESASAAPAAAATMADSGADAAASAPAAAAEAADDETSNDAQAVKKSVASATKERWAFLSSFFDADLTAVDGSTLHLTQRDGGGLIRLIRRPDGSAQTASFVFLNGRLGTVRDASSSNEMVATFRVTDSDMRIDYADGRAETVAPSSDGGLMIAYDVPGAPLYQTVWYPQGHVFSRAEREAAVIQLADRLAVDKSQGPSPSQAPVAAVAPAKPLRHAHAFPPKPVKTAAIPIPMPMPTDVAAPITPAKPVPSPTALHTASALNATRLAALTAAPIVVETREVHPIDAPAPKRSASDCLSVESDGQHWGFRNHCDADVQFSYCQLNGNDRLTACDRGAIAGSVAAHGFGALVADTSLKEADASHAFRWIACIGGAGEVMAQLAVPDPPQGRCVHAGDLPTAPAPTQSAQAGGTGTTKLNAAAAAK